MSLTRAALEGGVMRQIWHESGLTGSVLSDEELARGADAWLDQAGPGDPWVFAYGSLIWNPLLHHVERRCATLRGYHRRFCLWSKTTRGTPDCPGLVLGLEYGGSCRGVALRIDSRVAREEFRLLWKREMLSASYVPKCVRVGTPHGPIRALAFVIDRSHPNYAGKLSAERVAQVIRSACGKIGSSREYLRQTLDGLRSHGLADPLLDEIAVRVDELDRTG